jgi:HAD superfamily hydrolase (TIGR01549 family)
MVKILVPKAQKSDQAAQVGTDAADKGGNIEFDAKALIFDKDGTLLTHDHFVPIMQKRIELLTEEYGLSDEDQKFLMVASGLDPNTLEIIKKGTMFIARADTELLIQAFLGERGFRDSNVKSQVVNIFHEADLQVELEKYIKPLPGVPELLVSLKQHGAYLAIATHDSTAAAKKQLEIANLNQYLDAIIGLDYNGNILHKPSPSMLLAVCKKFNLEPNETVVVGDSKNDVLMGKSGGAGLSIAVLSGEHKKEDFENYDAIIDSVAQLQILD